MKIPFLSFDYQDNLFRTQIIESVTNVIDSKWYILGENLRKFEIEYSTLNKISYTVGVANGLDALIISLKALNITKGDEVIVPANTYIATWLAVSAVGAIPIPVEPDINTNNINIELIQNHINSKTKAIIPVHLYGLPCDMNQIMKIAYDNNLYVIEDNAQAHFAKCDDQMTGTFGHINATSFYPGKNLGAIGDAGAITTNNINFYEFVLKYRNYGSNIKYYNDIKGINSRLDEIQASILRVKLNYLDLITNQRISIAQEYTKLLQDVKEIKLPKEFPNLKHVYHLYVIHCEERDELQKFLTKKNIGTLIHYPVPPHLQEAYRDLGYKIGSFPISEKLAKECLSLPIYPGMKIEEIIYVVDSIKEFYNK